MLAYLINKYKSIKIHKSIRTAFNNPNAYNACVEIMELLPELEIKNTFKTRMFYDTQRYSYGTFSDYLRIAEHLSRVGEKGDTITEVKEGSNNLTVASTDEWIVSGGTYIQPTTIIEQFKPHVTRLNMSDSYQMYFTIRTTMFWEEFRYFLKLTYESIYVKEDVYE